MARLHRRDLLLLRPGRQARLVELPLGRLYMRYVEARTAAGRADPAPADPCGGEPPSEIDTPTVEVLFASLDEELRAAATLRLSEAHWLAEPAFRRHVEQVLAAFRARGGVVIEEP